MIWTSAGDVRFKLLSGGRQGRFLGASPEVPVTELRVVLFHLNKIRVPDIRLATAITASECIELFADGADHAG